MGLNDVYRLFQISVPTEIPMEDVSLTHPEIWHMDTQKRLREKFLQLTSSGITSILCGIKGCESEAQGFYWY